MKTHPLSSGLKLVIALAAGIITATLLSTLGLHKYIPLGAWNSAALLYGFLTWIGIRGADGTTTRKIAIRENPGKAVADVVIIVASLASLVAVARLLMGHETGLIEVVDIILSLISIFISWISIHLIYMLRYARMYYGKPEGGVDFNSDQPPAYSDFAYLAFTLGMTYQVSDTALQTKTFRKAALHHTLLSYLFGTVIIAATINAIVSLSQ